MLEERDGCLLFDGYTLVKDSLDCIPLDGKAVVNTISPNSYGLSRKDPDMDEALKGSDYLVLDGVYFGLWPLLRYGKRARRITGWDCFIYYLGRMQETGGKVFLLGSTPETLQKMTDRIGKEYPALRVRSYSPPFKPEFDEEDNRKMAEAVNAFAPDLLVVGMTAPKQEKWAREHWNELDIHCHCGTIGAVFDFFAGTHERAPKWWLDHNLEWLYRLLKEPKRMWKRNFVSTPKFLALTLKEKLGLR